MTASIKHDDERQWSSGNKRMEAGGNSLKTLLESLRARLLAERQSSKLAKEKEELMANKLIELESRLREETRLMRNAEKKLHLLMNKVESLKISPTSQGFELSISCPSSISSNSSTMEAEFNPKPSKQPL